MARLTCTLLFLVTLPASAVSFHYTEFIQNNGFESSTSSDPFGGAYRFTTDFEESVALETNDTFKGTKALRLTKPDQYRDKTTKITTNGNGNIFFDPPLTALHERIFRCHLAAKQVSAMEIQDEKVIFMRIASQGIDDNWTYDMIRVPYAQGQWSEITQYIVVPENTKRLYVVLHIKFATDIIIDDLSLTNAFLDSSMEKRFYFLGETLSMSHRILMPSGADFSSVTGSITIDTVNIELDGTGAVSDISEIVYSEAGVSPGSDGMFPFSAIDLQASNYVPDHMYRIRITVEGNGLDETRDQFFMITQNEQTPTFYWDLDRDGTKEKRFPLGFYSILHEDLVPLRDLDWVDFIRGTRSMYKDTDLPEFGMYLFPSFHYFERFIFEKDLMLDSVDRLLDNKDNQWAGGIDIGGEPVDDGVSPERGAWAYNLSKSYTPDRPVIQMTHRIEAFDGWLFGDAMTLWPNFKVATGGYSTENIHREYVENMEYIRDATDNRVPIFVFVPAVYLPNSSNADPTVNELRCVSTLALTLDPNGMMFNMDNTGYLFPGGSNEKLKNFLEDAPGHFDGMMKIGSAVDGMRAALLAPSPTNVTLIDGDNTDLKFIAKEDNTALFVIVSNYSEQSRSLVFSLGSLTGNLSMQAEELLTNQTTNLSVVDDEFILNVTIPDKEGFIYRIPKNGGSGGSGGLVAHWEMDEGSGFVTSDSSGNNNHAMVSGAQFVAPKVGNFALNFDGDNDYAEVLDSISLAASSAVTLSAWINPDNLAGGLPYPAIISKSSAYRLYLHTDKRVRFQIYEGGTSIVAKPSTTISDNTWTHIAGTFDGSQLNVYINGILEKTVSYSGSININQNPLYLGARHTAKDFFSGKIDDVRIYNSALTAQEVFDLFNPQDSDGLIARWDMEEGSGTTAFDSSGNGNHASISQAKFATPRTGNFALRFDGTNDYATVQDSSSLDASSEVTLAAWINPDNLAGGHPYTAIISKSSAYRLYVHTDQRIRFQIYNGGTSIVAKPTVTVPNLTWSHVAGTFDGSALKVYVNGTLEKTRSFSGSIDVNGNPLYLGARNNEKDFYDGKVDDVRVYNKALSSQEIFSLFNED